MGKGSLLVGFVVALALSTITTACGRADPAHLTLRQFQDRVVAEVTRQYPNAKVSRPDDHRVVVGIPGQIENTANLDRGFAFYQEAPGDLEGIVKDLVKSVGPHALPTAKDLVVLVRPEGGGSRHDVGEPLSKPLAGGLRAYVGVDLDDSYAIAPAAELRSTMKMDDAGLWATAFANTRAHLNFAAQTPRDGGPGEISNGSGLSSSLLAFDRYWDSPALTAAGPVVVATVARDDLLIARLSDTKSVDALRKFMAQVRDDPNGLTNDLIVRKDGHWEVLH